MSTFRRGRPPLSPVEGSTSVTVTLPVSVYDRIYAEGAAASPPVGVPQRIREAIERDFETRKKLKTVQVEK